MRCLESGSAFTVVLASPSPEGRGGMSTIAAELLEHADALLPDFCVTHVSTHPATAERTMRSALKSVALTMAASRRVIAIRPAILHLFVGARGSLVRNCYLAVVGRAIGSKVLLHTHSGDIDRALKGESVPGVPLPLLRLLLKLADCVAVLWSQGPLPEVDGLPVYVVPNQVSLQESPLAMYRDVDILFAGRIVLEKGAPLLAEVVDELCSRRPGLNIHIAGLPVGAAGDRVYARLRDNPCTTTHGWLDLPQVQSLMKKSRILLSPSAVDSLPMSVLHAGACGCWVMATPVGAVTDILADNRGSLIEGDADEWAASCLERLDSMQPDEEPNPNLRCYVEVRYSGAAMIDALRIVYGAIVGRR